MSPNPALLVAGVGIQKVIRQVVWWGSCSGRLTDLGLLAQSSKTREALIPLYRIWDAFAVFAGPMLSPPVFPG